MARFKGTSEEGLPEDYLGAELEFSEEEAAVYVHMQTGITKFLTEEQGFNPGGCRITLTPAIPGYSLHAYREGEELYQNLKHYQHVVGTLMYYATRERPDISNAVRELSRFAAKPTMEHLVASGEILHEVSSWDTVPRTDIAIWCTLRFQGRHHWPGKHNSKTTAFTFGDFFRHVA
jgi:hypothetical protein